MLGSSVSTADKILLKNGGRLSGTVDEDDRGYCITTSNGYSLVLPKEDVARIIAQSPVATPTVTATQAPEPTNTPSPTKTVTATATATPVDKKVQEAFRKRYAATATARVGVSYRTQERIDWTLNEPEAYEGHPPYTEDTQGSGEYWLNTKSGKRHNSGCRWFGDTQNGRRCGPDEGTACKTCGG